MAIDSEQLPPEPEQTGVEPVQIKPSKDDREMKMLSPSVGGIGHYPLTEAIREISEGGVRGQAGMLLLYASTQRLESDLLIVRQERDSAIKEMNTMKDSYFAKKELVEILRERLTSIKTLRTTQNVMITLGGVVTGTAASFLKTDNLGWPIAGILLGICLLWGGWYGSHDKDKEVG